MHSWDMDFSYNLCNSHNLTVGKTFRDNVISQRIFGSHPHGDKNEVLRRTQTHFLQYAGIFLDIKNTIFLFKNCFKNLEKLRGR